MYFCGLHKNETIPDYIYVKPLLLVTRSQCFVDILCVMQKNKSVYLSYSNKKEFKFLLRVLSFSEAWLIVIANALSKRKEKGQN